MQILSFSTTSVILSPGFRFIPSRIGFGMENPTEFHQIPVVFKHRLLGIFLPLFNVDTFIHHILKWLLYVLTEGSNSEYQTRARLPFIFVCRLFLHYEQGRLYGCCDFFGGAPYATYP